MEEGDVSNNLYKWKCDRNMNRGHAYHAFCIKTFYTLFLFLLLRHENLFNNKEEVTTSSNLFQPYWPDYYIGYCYYPRDVKCALASN